MLMEKYEYGGWMCCCSVCHSSYELSYLTDVSTGVKLIIPSKSI